jgi:hypothetical protein
MKVGSWASDSFGESPGTTLENCQRSLTVDLISTRRAEFETCDAGEMVGTVLRRAGDFDFIPVVCSKPETASSDRIAGLLDVRQCEQKCQQHTPVSNCLSPLSDENLIGADASIIAFIRDADRYTCRLVVSSSRAKILVDWSVCRIYKNYQRELRFLHW